MSTEWVGWLKQHISVGTGGDLLWTTNHAAFGHPYSFTYSAEAYTRQAIKPMFNGGGRVLGAYVSHNPVRTAIRPAHGHYSRPGRDRDADADRRRAGAGRQPAPDHRGAGPGRGERTRGPEVGDVPHRRGALVHQCQPRRPAALGHAADLHGPGRLERARAPLPAGVDDADPAAPGPVMAALRQRRQCGRLSRWNIRRWAGRASGTRRTAGRRRRGSPDPGGSSSAGHQAAHLVARRRRRARCRRAAPRRAAGSNGSATRSMVRSQTSATIWHHSSDWAPPPTSAQRVQPAAGEPLGRAHAASGR